MPVRVARKITQKYVVWSCVLFSHGLQESIAQRYETVEVESFLELRAKKIKWESRVNVE